MAPKRNLLQVNVKIQVTTEIVERQLKSKIFERQLKAEKDRNDALQHEVSKLMLEKECLWNTLNLMAQEWKKDLQENKQLTKRILELDQTGGIESTSVSLEEQRWS